MLLPPKIHDTNENARRSLKAVTGVFYCGDHFEEIVLRDCLRDQFLFGISSTRATCNSPEASCCSFRSASSKGAVSMV